MEFSAGNSSRSSSHDEGMQMISLTIGTLQVTTEQNPRSPSSTPDRTSPAASPASSAPRDCGAITAVNITRYPAPTPEHPDAAGVVPPATSQRVGVVLAGCDSGASEAGVRTPGSSAPAPTAWTPSGPKKKRHRPRKLQLQKSFSLGWPANELCSPIVLPRTPVVTGRLAPGDPLPTPALLGCTCRRTPTPQGSLAIRQQMLPGQSGSGFWK